MLVKIERFQMDMRCSLAVTRPIELPVEASQAGQACFTHDE